MTRILQLSIAVAHGNRIARIEYETSARWDKLRITGGLGADD